MFSAVFVCDRQMDYFYIHVIDMKKKLPKLQIQILGSIVVSIPACHAGGRGSIPSRGGAVLFINTTQFGGYIQYIEGCTWLYPQV